MKTTYMTPAKLKVLVSSLRSEPFNLPYSPWKQITSQLIAVNVTKAGMVTGGLLLFDPNTKYTKYFRYCSHTKDYIFGDPR